MPQDFYDLLGVSEEATADELKAAYRAKAREFHPDVNADTRANAQFKTVRKAYEVLSDETERAAYDRTGHEQYVSERLDGLPTADVPRRADSGGSRWSQDGSIRDRRGGSSTGSESTSASETGGSSKRTASASTSASTSSSTSNRTGAGRTGAPGGASASGATTRADARRDPRRARRVSPLAVAWASVLAVGAFYLVGLARYVGANAAAASSFVAAFGSDPTGAVTATHGFGSPATFAASAVAAGTPDLLFPAGAALLVVAFAGVVARFGHGTAWLYAAAAVAPAVGLLAASALPRTAGVLLLVFVALPVGATLTFAFDVGRYLRAA